MKAFLPLDIESAKAYGLGKWRDRFFWPVSYDRYVQMETEIKSAFNQLINENSENGLGELLIVNYKLFLEFSALIYSLKVLKELEDMNITPLCGSTSVNFKGIIENGIPLRRRLPVPSAPRISLAGKMRSRLGLALARMRLTGRAKDFLWQPLRSRTCITDRSFLKGLLLEYILKELNGQVALRDSWQWYSRQNGDQFGAGQREGIVGLVVGILEKMALIACSNGLQLTDGKLMYLRGISEDTLSAAAFCLEALKKYVSRLRPMHLLIGSGGNQLARMLSAAFRCNGGRVTGFKHGEPVFHMWDYNSWLDLAAVDRFVTYTEASARALDRVQKAYPVPGGGNVRCEGMATDMFYDLWRRESKKAFPRKIKCVMLVAKGLQYDNKISQGIAFPELVQLDWELSIIDILRKAGCKVLYKCHPDGDLSAHMGGLFEKDVSVVIEPFADVMGRADCFIFYHTITTTLGEALCTNKPVIYIDGGWEPWVSEIFGPFSRRCRVVPAWFDDRNRLEVDKARLLDALFRDPSEPDMEFACTYMFPGYAEV